MTDSTAIIYVVIYNYGQQKHIVHDSVLQGLTACAEAESR